MSNQPTAPAGWYPVEGDPTTVTWWDGYRWTGQTAPVLRPCPYCMHQIPARASRCAACAGQLRHCGRCRQMVGVWSKQKFVGLLRGGMKAQLRCLNCDKVLDGPRF